MAERLPYFSEIVNLDNNSFGFSPLLCATTNQDQPADKQKSVIKLLLDNGAEMML